MPVIAIIQRESEAHRLVPLGRALAADSKQQLHLLLLCEGGSCPEVKAAAEIEWSEVEFGCDGGKGQPPDWWGAVMEACPKDEETPETRTFHVAAGETPGMRGPEIVLEAADHFRADLLLLEKQRAAKGEAGEEVLARAVFAQTRCATLVLRADENTETVGIPISRIMVSLPASGGEHAQRALRIGKAIAKGFGCPLVPVHITPDTDPLSADLGRKIVYRALSSIGIKSEDQAEIDARVIVSDSVEAGLVEAVGDGEETLLLFGAPDVAHLRRHLFGTLPERMTNQGQGLSVGVVKEAAPLDHRIRHQLSRSLRLRIPQLDREARIDLFERLGTESRWSFDFMALICLSTCIAAIGLIQNSTAVVIGAMLVAPLMVPLLGSGLAIVQGNLPLMRKALLAVVLGFLSALGIGFAVGYLAPWFDGVTPEMAARGEPTPLDLGVAFFSGIAASYCIARPRLSSALAGVAIAAALVPPIATVGITLNLGEFGIARGAALLFSTNVVAIILGASLNFALAGIGGSDRLSTGRLWSRRIVLLLLLCLAALALPLGSRILQEVVDPEGARIETLLSDGLHERTAELVEAEGLEVEKIRLGRENYLEVFLRGPTPPSQSTIDKLAQALGEEGAIPEGRSVITHFQQVWVRREPKPEPPPKPEPSSNPTAEEVAP